ncbi:hypothetical protein L2E82_38851 [Cichorium intybus]|uniref:Uncharacterized protein n=1 Tax=Cichorium intybus TaxID=13427 RepID=A0ACB9AGX6_CICIN|nr:hypothetical protein L2E82_38851 [Cichorium intybus]
MVVIYGGGCLVDQGPVVGCRNDEAALILVESVVMQAVPRGAVGVSRRSAGGHREIQVSVSLFIDFALQVDMLLKLLKAGKHVIQAISEVETPLSCYNSICNNPSTQTIWAVAENYRFELAFDTMVNIETVDQPTQTHTSDANEENGILECDEENKGERGVHHMDLAHAPLAPYRDDKESQPSTSSSSIEWSQPCRPFEFHEILLATDNFNEALVIGHGGFGKVFKGATNKPSTYVNTLVKGTFGYIDPNYYTTGRLTRKSDVYSFGVVLLEVLCRKRAVDRSLDEEQWGLVSWAHDYIKEGNLKSIIDSGVRRQISPKCLKDFVRIIKRCLHNNPKQRPTMAEVVVSLDSVLALQQKIDAGFLASGRTIYGRLLDMFPFPFHGDSSGISHS